MIGKPHPEMIGQVFTYHGPRGGTLKGKCTDTRWSYGWIRKGDGSEWRGFQAKIRGRWSITFASDTPYDRCNGNPPESGSTLHEYDGDQRGD